jgi:hypothetical protein
MKNMSEQQVKEYAKAQGWVFVRYEILPLGGYWRSSDGSAAYYARKSETKEERKR